MSTGGGLCPSVLPIENVPLYDIGSTLWQRPGDSKQSGSNACGVVLWMPLNVLGLQHTEG